jgi:hypothetical protein
MNRQQRRAAERAAQKGKRADEGYMMISAHSPIPMGLKADIARGTVSQVRDRLEWRHLRLACRNQLPVAEGTWL